MTIEVICRHLVTPMAFKDADQPDDVALCLLSYPRTGRAERGSNPQPRSTRPHPIDPAIDGNA